MKKMFLALFALSLALLACETEGAKQSSQTANSAAPAKAAVAPAANAPAANAPAANAPAKDAVIEKAPGQFAKNVMVKTIDWAKANELAAAGGLFVDVRYPEELNQGYVLNSVNIPLNEIKARVNELPKDKDLLVYCRSGRRSEAASNLLQKLGFERVYNVAGGYIAYPKN